MAGAFGVVGGRLVQPPRTYDAIGNWYTNTVTSGAANAKGSWVQVVSSMPEAATAVNLNISGIGSSNANTAGVVDIGIGPSGSEVVVASNIAVGMALIIEFVVPLAIPAGSRVALRHQNAANARASTIRSQFMRNGPISFPPSSVDVIGVTSATSRGTALATSGWTTIVASTSQAYQAVVPVFSAGGTTSITATTGSSLIAYGASGSEVQVNANFTITTTSEVITSINGAGWDCGACPAGTRISGRKGGNTNIEVCIIGVPYST